MMHIRERGFTIVEISIVVAMIGIISAIGIPMGIRLVENSRLNSASSAIRSILALARSRALANPQTHCGVFVDTSAAGLIVFFDDNGNGRYDSTGASPDRIYRARQSLPRGILIKAVPLAWTQAVIFRGDGSVRHGGSFTVRIGAAGKSKTISITKESGEVVISP